MGALIFLVGCSINSQAKTSVFFTVHGALREEPIPMEKAAAAQIPLPRTTTTTLQIMEMNARTIPMIKMIATAMMTTTARPQLLLVLRASKHRRLKIIIMSRNTPRSSSNLVHVVK